MIDWLNQVLFTLGADHVTWAELLGFLTGGGCVLLTVRSNIGNFPVGIANSALFLFLFLSARLWADGVLQVVYIVLGFVGWWQWLHGGAQHGALVVGWARQREVVACLAFVVVGAAALTFVLRAADDIAPFLDAVTTCLSLAAQWLLNAKRIQTWFFWIAADCVYVPLYAGKHLVLTAIVYLLFLGLCAAGLRSWVRTRRSMLTVAPPAAAVLP